MYLDYAATTPLSEDMKNYIIELLDVFYNPSSTYQNGLYTKNIIEEARKSVADFINADPDNIYFTSGGSAANTLGIKGYFQKQDCCILYSPTAHKSILECVKTYNHSFPLKVDSHGHINIEDLREWMDSRQINPFVVIEYANSEIGTIQPVKEIIDLVHFYNGIVMLDCTGSISTIPLDVKALDVDIATFSAHKLGALKGCGVLYKKSKINLEPIIYGSQEKGLVGGTENVLAIASLGFSVGKYEYSSVSNRARNYLLVKMFDEIDSMQLIGTPSDINRLPHNICVMIDGINASSLMTLLDLSGFQVSTGSACNNYSNTPSPTLLAIGLTSKEAQSCLRITLSGTEMEPELDSFCLALKRKVNLLRMMEDC